MLISVHLFAAVSRHLSLGGAQPVAEPSRQPWVHGPICMLKTGFLWPWYGGRLAGCKILGSCVLSVVSFNAVPWLPGFVGWFWEAWCQLNSPASITYWSLSLKTTRLLRIRQSLFLWVNFPWYSLGPFRCVDFVLFLFLESFLGL